MVKYNLPTNATEPVVGIFSLFQWIQEVSGGVFFLVIMLAIFVISFIAGKNYATSRAFAFAAFLNFILSVIFRTLGFISNMWMYLSLIIVAASVVWLHADNTQRI